MSEKVEERIKELEERLASTKVNIVNAAARDVLGSHINQAGAKKNSEKFTFRYHTLRIDTER